MPNLACQVLRAIASASLPGPLFRLRVRAMRRLWTPRRIAAYYDARLPRCGCVNARELTSAVAAMGAHHEDMAAARGLLGIVTWDGDGHHLTMWMRRTATPFRLPEHDPRHVEGLQEAWTRRADLAAFSRLKRYGVRIPALNSEPAEG
ncbi:MAG TPA: hypothetical protein VD838_16390 [Anaeromyxobacteraceae bacterium]|nr:hypothetical protein [Anaeromyxobacteraceae bacterium]